MAKKRKQAAATNEEVKHELMTDAKGRVDKVKQEQEPLAKGLDFFGANQSIFSSTPTPEVDSVAVECSVNVDETISILKSTREGLDSQTIHMES